MATILVYAMNYAPEVAGVGRYTGEIGDYLAEIGHEVVVLTTIPHYPGWKPSPPYRDGRYAREMHGCAEIVLWQLALSEREFCRNGCCALADARRKVTIVAGFSS